MSQRRAVKELEKDQLDTLEGVISREMGSFMAVGKALLTIRDWRLYREQFRNFKIYCAEKWGMSRTHSTRLIGGSQVATNLLTSEHFTSGAKLTPHGANFNTLVKIQPTSEYQIRPLTTLEPAQQCEVWEKAVKTAPAGKITHKHVDNTVKELTAPALSQTLHLLLTRDSPIPAPPGERLLPPLCPLGAPFAGRSGAVSGPESRRFILSGGGLGAHLRVPVLSPGDVGQEKGDDTRADFWIPSVLPSAPPGPAPLPLV